METSHFYIDYGHMILFLCSLECSGQTVLVQQSSHAAKTKQISVYRVVDACSTHMGAKVVKN